MSNEQDVRYERDWQDGFIDNFYVHNLSDEALNEYEKLRLSDAEQLKYVARPLTETQKFQILERLGLCENKRIRRAAVLLFADNPDKFLPGSYIKIGMFTSDNKQIKDITLYEPIIKIITSAAKLITSDFVRTDKLFFGLVRRDINPIPMLVLREAIANAVVHKKYSSKNPIVIKVKPDEILIVNHMILPDGWTEDTFNKGTETNRLNQLIVQTLEHTHLIEGWGTGIQRIHDVLRKAKPSPLRRANYSILGNQLFLSLPNPTGILGSDVIDREGYDFTDFERKIIIHFNENERITRKQCAKLLNETKLQDRQINNILNKLVEKGILKMLGAGPSTYYELKF